MCIFITLSVRYKTEIQTFDIEEIALATYAGIKDALLFDTSVEYQAIGHTSRMLVDNRCNCKVV